MINCNYEMGDLAVHGIALGTHCVQYGSFYVIARGPFRLRDSTM